jgi:hypothetical protein
MRHLRIKYATSSDLPNQEPALLGCDYEATVSFQHDLSPLRTCEDLGIPVSTMYSLSPAMNIFLGGDHWYLLTLTSGLLARYSRRTVASSSATRFLSQVKVDSITTSSATRCSLDSTATTDFSLQSQMHAIEMTIEIRASARKTF